MMIFRIVLQTDLIKAPRKLCRRYRAVDLVEELICLVSTEWVHLEEPQIVLILKLREMTNIGASCNDDAAPLKVRFVDMLRWVKQ
jgi:hypothetical protein